MQRAINDQTQVLHGAEADGDLATTEEIDRLASRQARLADLLQHLINPQVTAEDVEVHRQHRKDAPALEGLDRELDLLLP